LQDDNLSIFISFLFTTTTMMMTMTIGAYPRNDPLFGGNSVDGWMVGCIYYVGCYGCIGMDLIWEWNGTERIWIWMGLGDGDVEGRDETDNLTLRTGLLGYRRRRNGERRD
jgi:hypothetical protein